MAFKEVSGQAQVPAIALGGFNKTTRQDNPTELQGYYTGSREVNSPKSNTGKALLHMFQREDGSEAAVWGKTDLDKKLAVVDPGTLVRVTYTGTTRTKGGQMYTYKVEIDESQTIAVGASSDEEHDDNPNAEFDKADETAPARNTPPRKAAAAPSAASQANVRALLNNKRVQA